MNPIVIILPHKAAQETFDRHLPFWEWHGLPVVVAQSSDAPVETRHQQFTYGPSCHSGADAINKIKAVLHWFAKSGHSHAAIFEYDSLLLQKRIEFPNGLTGVLMPNTEPSRFMAPRYPLVPWTVDRASVLRLLEITDRYPTIMEEGAGDRFMAAICQVAGVPVLPFSPPGYGEGTIQPLFSPTAGLLLDALQHGARAIHGIKDKAALDFIVQECRCLGIPLPV